MMLVMDILVKPGETFSRLRSLRPVLKIELIARQYIMFTV